LLKILCYCVISPSAIHSLPINTQQDLQISPVWKLSSLSSAASKSYRALALISVGWTEGAAVENDSDEAEGYNEVVVPVGLLPFSRRESSMAKVKHFELVLEEAHWRIGIWQSISN
jgi:hypothetical protein